MIRRVVMFVSVALALAAARDLGAQVRGLNVWLKGFQYPVKLDSIAIWNDVLETPAETFSVVKRIVDSLRIPVATADSANGLLYNAGFTVRSKLAGRPASWSLRCGYGLGGDYADTWRVTIAYAIFVDPAVDKGSRLGMAFVSFAQSIEGTSKAPLPCATTGALENHILKLAHLEMLKR